MRCGYYCSAIGKTSIQEGMIVKKNWIFIAGAVVLIVVLSAVMSWKSATPAKDTKSAAAAVAPVPDGFDKGVQNAAALELRGELLEARNAYKAVIAVYASRPGIEEVQKKLEDLNMRVMCSGITIPNETALREIKAGDSLSMIADEFRTTAAFIKKQNGLKSDVIRVGQRLRIWMGRLSIYIDKSQNVLTLRSNTDLVKTYRVSTGKDNITPIGTFKLINKLVDPTWTHEGKVYASGDPENVLGTRWMGFDLSGYGIHGTTLPETIGTQATAGCVRMLNSEVEELFDLLPVNTEVTIVE
jgi:lipoprotein-anchoring transpeptidase ErfK/SrfK